MYKYVKNKLIKTKFHKNLGSKIIMHTLNKYGRRTESTMAVL